MVPSTTSSSSLPPAELGSRIATALQAKALQAARQQGAQEVQLIANAGQAQTPAAPSAGDALVAKATGLGTLLDVVG
jgi:hypothetical protein